MTNCIVEYLLGAIRRGGFHVNINGDMSQLMETFLSVDGKKTGNPEFDPLLHDLNEENCLWLEIRDKAGDIVATSAGRLLETEDLVGLTRSYRLWYGDKIRFSDPLTIVLPPDVTVPSGRLVFDGAMWVRRDQRRRGFSWVIGRLLKAITHRRWNPDWYFGIAFQSIARSRLPIYSYGYPRLSRLAEGYHVPGYASQSLSLASMSRAEYTRLAAEDSGLMEASPELAVGPQLALKVAAARQKMHAQARRELAGAGFGLAS